MDEEWKVLEPDKSELPSQNPLVTSDNGVSQDITTFASLTQHTISGLASHDTTPAELSQYTISHLETPEERAQTNHKDHIWKALVPEPDESASQDLLSTPTHGTSEDISTFASLSQHELASQDVTAAGVSQDTGREQTGIPGKQAAGEEEYRIAPIGFNDSRDLQEMEPLSPTYLQRTVPGQDVRETSSVTLEVNESLTQYPLESLNEAAHNLSNDVLNSALFELTREETEEEVDHVISEVSSKFVLGKLAFSPQVSTGGGLNYQGSESGGSTPSSGRRSQADGQDLESHLITVPATVPAKKLVENVMDVQDKNKSTVSLPNRANIIETTKEPFNKDETDTNLSKLTDERAMESLEKPSEYVQSGQLGGPLLDLGGDLEIEILGENKAESEIIPPTASRGSYNKEPSPEESQRGVTEGQDDIAEPNQKTTQDAFGRGVSPNLSVNSSRSSLETVTENKQSKQVLGTSSSRTSVESAGSERPLRSYIYYPPELRSRTPSDGGSLRCSELDLTQEQAAPTVAEIEPQLLIKNAGVEDYVPVHARSELLGIDPSVETTTGLTLEERDKLVDNILKEYALRAERGDQSLTESQVDQWGVGKESSVEERPDSGISNFTAAQSDQPTSNSLSDRAISLSYPDQSIESGVDNKGFTEAAQSIHTVLRSLEAPNENSQEHLTVPSEGNNPTDRALLNDSDRQTSSMSKTPKAESHMSTLQMISNANTRSEMLLAQHLFHDMGDESPRSRQSDSSGTQYQDLPDKMAAPEMSIIEEVLLEHFSPPRDHNDSGSTSDGLSPDVKEIVRKYEWYHREKAAQQEASAEHDFPTRGRMSPAGSVSDSGSSTAKVSNVAETKKEEAKVPDESEVRSCVDSDNDASVSISLTGELANRSDASTAPSIPMSTDSAAAAIQRIEDLLSHTDRPASAQSKQSTGSGRPHSRQSIQSTDSLGTRVHNLLAHTQHLEKFGGRILPIEDRLPRGDIDLDALEKELDAIQGGLAAIQNADSSQGSHGLETSRTPDKIINTSQTSDSTGRFNRDYSADLQHIQDGRLRSPSRDLGNRSAPDGFGNETSPQSLGQSQTSPRSLPGMGLADRVYRLLVEQSPHSQAYKYLEEAEEQEKEADRSRHERELLSSSAFDDSLRQRMYEQSGTSLQYPGDTPLTGLSPGLSFHVSPVSKGPFAAFSQVQTFLSSQMDKVSTAEFDHSIELRTPFRDRLIMPYPEDRQRHYAAAPNASPEFFKKPGRGRHQQFDQHPMSYSSETAQAPYQDRQSSRSSQLAGAHAATLTTPSVVNSTARGRLSNGSENDRSAGSVDSPSARVPTSRNFGEISPIATEPSQQHQERTSTAAERNTTNTLPKTSPPPNLRPYKPASSQEVYYVESGTEDNTSVAHSETTVESTHEGSDDAQAPAFPSHFMGSRREAPKNAVGIYGKETSPRMLTSPRALSTILEQSRREDPSFTDKDQTSDKSVKKTEDWVNGNFSGQSVHSEHAQAQNLHTRSHGTYDSQSEPSTVREVVAAGTDESATELEGRVVGGSDGSFQESLPAGAEAASPNLVHAESTSYHRQDWTTAVSAASPLNQHYPTGRQVVGSEQAVSDKDDAFMPLVPDWGEDSDDSSRVHRYDGSSGRPKRYSTPPRSRSPEPGLDRTAARGQQSSNRGNDEHTEKWAKPVHRHDGPSMVQTSQHRSSDRRHDYVPRSSDRYTDTSRSSARYYDSVQWPSGRHSDSMTNSYSGAHIDGYSDTLLSKSWELPRTHSPERGYARQPETPGGRDFRRPLSKSMEGLADRSRERDKKMAESYYNRCYDQNIRRSPSPHRRRSPVQQNRRLQDSDASLRESLNYTGTSSYRSLEDMGLSRRPVSSTPLGSGQRDISYELPSNVNELWERFQEINVRGYESSGSSKSVDLSHLDSLLKNPTKHLIKHHQVASEDSQVRDVKARVHSPVYMEIPAGENKGSGRSRKSQGRKSSHKQNQEATSGHEHSANTTEEKTGDLKATVEKQKDDQELENGHESGQQYLSETQQERPKATEVLQVSTTDREPVASKDQSMSTQEVSSATQDQSEASPEMSSTSQNPSSPSREESQDHTTSSVPSSQDRSEKAAGEDSDHVRITVELENSTASNQTQTDTSTTSSRSGHGKNGNKMFAVVGREETLTSIPEDSTIDSITTDFTSDLTSSSMDSDVRVLLCSKRHLPADPKFIKLQQKIVRQKEKYEREKTRKQKRKHKIARLEQLLTQKAKLEQLLAEKAKPEWKSPKEKFINPKNESTPSAMQTNNFEVESSPVSTITVMSGTTPQVVPSSDSTLVESDVVKSPNAQRKSKVGVTSKKDVSGAPRKSKEHLASSPSKSKKSKSKDTKLKLQEVDYSGREKPVIEVHKENMSYLEYVKPSKHTARKTVTSPKKVVSSKNAHSPKQIKSDKTSSGSLSKYRTVGTNCPTPMEKSPPSRRRIMEVTMVSEAIQTSPVVQGKKAGILDRTPDSRLAKDTITSAKGEYGRSKSPQPGMFTPEKEPLPESRSPTQGEKPKTRASMGGMAWFLPMKETRPWRAPLKERQAHAVAMDTWPRDGIRQRSPDSRVREAWGSDPRTWEPYSGPKGGEDVKGTVSLQEAFLLSKQDFISHSREREKYIALRAEERRIQELHRCEREQLFAGNRKKVANPQSHPLSEQLFNPQKRVMTKHAMKEHTERIYKTLPEVMDKDRERKKAEDFKSNRLRAQLYKQRILNKVLNKKGPWLSS